MTVDEVQERIRLQAGDDLGITNDHRITLKQVLVVPERITVIERSVQSGRIKDQEEDVWLVGQEASSDGYRIIMREDGSQFGLASKGFPTDSLLVLTGWYGSLKSAFIAM